ncbi:heparin lyase I family protein [Flavivirga eckloniae]|uniref:Uncharacterized protein n=1 Tax=Flavivirga eckloniae TaxID=1803846 RepID=A0A2K9PN96_9FLAO|nr:heparin lyase I family protein [Flavivirga eckloniae]AUP78531.1 hypothetical protein C1H87_07330 [Flavivirga eckloniae]
MKKTKLLFSFLILLLVSTSLSAQVYIDGENASIRQSDGYITDNGRTLRWQNQGNGQVTPWITGYNRAGSKGIGMLINGTSGTGPQRSEYCLNACYQSEPAINNGETWYTGFSFQLDSNTWANPTSWFVLQQTQQSKSAGQGNNNPFVSFDIKSGNKLDLRAGSGIDGATGLSFKHKEIITVQKGVWYDVVIGFKFSPNSTNGWMACWIKTKNQSNYTRYGMDNIKVGYTNAPQRIQQNKIGMYRNSVPGANKLYLDEIRFSKTLSGAKIPGSSGASNTGGSQTVTNGIYYIQDPAGNIRINSPSGRIIDKAKSNTKSAKWQITKVGSYYTIKNLRNGEYLEVPYAACNINQKPQNKNVNLGTWTSSGSNHQRWNITKSGSDYFFKPLHCNKVIDRNGNGNNPMHLWVSQSGNSNQNWRLIATNSSKSLNDKTEIADPSISTEPEPESIDQEKFMIFPNPVNDAITIRINSNPNTNAKIYLYNNIGSLIKTEPLESDDQSLKLNGLSSGIYILEVVNGSNTYRQKIIKK